MYKGLLDFVASPEGQGLLGGVAAGMASARPGAPWNTAGRGLLGGLASYGSALDRQNEQTQLGLLNQDRSQMREYRDLQMGQMRHEMDIQKGQQDWRKGFADVYKQAQPQTYDMVDVLGDGTGVGQASTVGNPQALNDYLRLPNSPFADEVLRQQMFPKKAEPFTLGEGQVRYGGDGQIVARGPAKTPDKTSVEQMLDAAGITDPKIRSAYIGQALQKSVTHAPAANTNVVLKQEGEEAKAVGKYYGDAYANMQSAGLSAQSKINRYTRLGQLLDGVNTGKFAGAGLELAKAANSIGFNLDPNTANMEAAQALSGEIALELRNPSGGAGMPGAMSDADRQFLQNMVPGLQTTPEGRTLMLDTSKKLAQRDMDVARLAREYRKRHGQINEGFYDELARFSEANPLFQQSRPAGNTNGFQIRRVR